MHTIKSADPSVSASTPAKSTLRQWITLASTTIPGKKKKEIKSQKSNN